MQAAQLSLLPDQVPALPATLLAQFPEPRIAEAVTLLAHLIAKASLRADPVEKAQVSVGE